MEVQLSVFRIKVVYLLGHIRTQTSQLTQEESSQILAMVQAAQLAVVILNYCITMVEQKMGLLRLLLTIQIIDYLLIQPAQLLVGTYLILMGLQ